MKVPAKTLPEIFEYDAETGAFKWKKHKFRNLVGKLAGCLDERGYWVLRIKNKKYYGHAVAWAIYYGRWPAFLLDHKNQNKADNSILNLRRSTKSNNGANRSMQVNNTSGYKGVYRISQQSNWFSQIKVRNKLIYLGVFCCKEAAHAAYASAAVKYFGEHARAI